MFKVWIPVFLSISLIFISCSKYQESTPDWSSYFGDYEGGGGSSYDYGVNASGKLSDNIQSIVVSGEVFSLSTPNLSGLKVKITRVSSKKSKTANTNKSGKFSASFDDPGTSSEEDFDIKVIGISGESMSETETIEVDLTGEWEGEMTITSMDSVCEGIPVISSLDTDVTVEQKGSRFTIYLGAPLNLYGINVNLSEDLTLDGEGSIGVPSSLAGFINCYGNISYSFVGDLYTDTSPPTFDVDFAATLSGSAGDCGSAPSNDCSLEGTLTGEKI